MSLTLKDLRVVRYSEMDRDLVTDPASLADLVEVLKDHGAFDVERPRLSTFETGGEVYPPGRYLVLPLDGTTPK